MKNFGDIGDRIHATDAPAPYPRFFSLYHSETPDEHRQKDLKKAPRTLRTGKTHKKTHLPPLPRLNPTESPVPKNEKFRGYRKLNPRCRRSSAISPIFFTLSLRGPGFVRTERPETGHPEPPISPENLPQKDHLPPFPRLRLRNSSPKNEKFRGYRRPNPRCTRSRDTSRIVTQSIRSAVRRRTKLPENKPTGTFPTQNPHPPPFHPSLPHRFPAESSVQKMKNFGDIRKRIHATDAPGACPRFFSLYLPQPLTIPGGMPPNKPQGTSEAGNPPQNIPSPSGFSTPGRKTLPKK